MSSVLLPVGLLLLSCPLRGGRERADVFASICILQGGDEREIHWLAQAKVAKLDMTINVEEQAVKGRESVAVEVRCQGQGLTCQA